MNVKIFSNPPKKYRAVTFWALNGKLEKTELLRQISVLDEMGFGGAFLHSRTGLKTEYLSDEWFELTRMCADELDSRGMRAFLYDEDRYPSGSCAGFVTRDGKLAAKYITVEKRPADGESPIAAFRMNFDGEYYTNYERCDAREANVFFYVREACASDVYNGFVYPDLMDIRATERFLAMTLDGYRAAAGDLFGNKICGVFTDEPNRGAIFNGFAHRGENVEARVPYTEKLFGEFSEMFGYDLSSRLPELYFRKKGEPYSVVAHDYTQAVTALFIRNFIVPYSQYAKKNGLALTGHILHEDNLCAIATLAGSPMCVYEHMDIPGMDNLTADNTCLPVPVMVASAARQCGKTETLSEMYAGIGWQADFQTYKRVGDWQAVSGITSGCAHLSWYTMGGIAKRDYPASSSCHAVWHKDYKLVEDYFARMSYFASQGKRRCELLVIHPNESAWGLNRLGAYKNCFVPTDGVYAELERTYFETCEKLLTSGVAFDYCDEDMMARIGGVVNRGGIPRVKIGKCAYSTVLVCGNLSLRASTADLLKKFISRGGKVFVCGKPPEYIGGKRAPEYFLRGAEFIGENELVSKTSDGRISVTGCKTLVKVCDGKGETFVTVVSLENEKRIVKTEIEGECSVTKYDLRDGGIYALEAKYIGGNTVIDTEFPPHGELCLRLTRGRCENPRVAERFVEVEPRLVGYRLKEKNALVLDIADCYVNGEFLCRDELLRIDAALRKKLGLPQRTPDAKQPWYAKKYCGEKAATCMLDLKFTFYSDGIYDATLTAEQTDKFTFTLNGVRLDADSGVRSARDICFKDIPIPAAALVTGKNELVLSCVFDGETDIENLFVCGDFGVTLDPPTLTRLPESLELGDIVPQGLPFYSGEIEYIFEVPRGDYRVRVCGMGGALARVCGMALPFEPYECDVGDADVLTVGVTATQRNVYGPLHYDPPLPCLGAYDDFVNSQRFVCGYSLVRQGLYESPLCKKRERPD